MRKILCIVFCVLTIGMLALPAFAMGASSSADYQYFSYLPFDEISWYGSSAFYSGAFPFNYGVEGGIVNFDYFDSDDYPELFGYQGTSYENGEFWITGDLSFADFGNAPSFSLTAYNKFIYVPSFADKFIISVNPSDIKIDSTHLYVEYYVKERSASGDRWVLTTRNFSHNEAYYPSGVIDVSYQFESLARAVGSNDIFIHYMDFTVNYHRLSASTPSFDFDIPATDEQPGYDPSYWVYDQNLMTEEVIGPAEPSEPIDTMSWLIDSVEVFLDTEFFPNFSISKLILLILVIGIVLWFITLLI